MKLSQKDQIEFAKEVLALEAETTNVEQLMHLKKLASLLIVWTEPHNDIAVSLDEYMYEVVATAHGRGDDGWKDEFKRILLEEISFTSINKKPKNAESSSTSRSTLN
jgi:hypothetical protein